MIIAGELILKLSINVVMMSRIEVKERWYCYRVNIVFVRIDWTLKGTKEVNYSTSQL